MSAALAGGMIQAPMEGAPVRTGRNDGSSGVVVSAWRSTLAMFVLVLALTVTILCGGGRVLEQGKPTSLGWTIAMIGLGGEATRPRGVVGTSTTAPVAQVAATASGVCDLSERYMHVLRIGEGLSAWIIGLAEVAQLASHLNRTLVLPCVRSGVIVPCLPGRVLEERVLGEDTRASMDAAAAREAALADAAAFPAFRDDCPAPGGERLPQASGRSFPLTAYFTHHAIVSLLATGPLPPPRLIAYSEWWAAEAACGRDADGLTGVAAELALARVAGVQGALGRDDNDADAIRRIYTKDGGQFEALPEAPPTCVELAVRAPPPARSSTKTVPGDMSVRMIDACARGLTAASSGGMLVHAPALDFNSGKRCRRGRQRIGSSVWLLGGVICPGDDTWTRHSPPTFRGARKQFPQGAAVNATPLGGALWRHVTNLVISGWQRDSLLAPPTLPELHPAHGAAIRAWVLSLNASSYDALQWRSETRNYSRCMPRIAAAAVAGRSHPARPLVLIADVSAPSNPCVVSFMANTSQQRPVGPLLAALPGSVKYDADLPAFIDPGALALREYALAIGAKQYLTCSKPFHSEVCRSCFWPSQFIAHVINERKQLRNSGGPELGAPPTDLRDP